MQEPVTEGESLDDMPMTLRLTYRPPPPLEERVLAAPETDLAEELNDTGQSEEEKVNGCYTGLRVDTVGQRSKVVEHERQLHKLYGA